VDPAANVTTGAPTAAGGAAREGIGAQASTQAEALPTRGRGFHEHFDPPELR
jgi:hypothetical protein